MARVNDGVMYASRRTLLPERWARSYTERDVPPEHCRTIGCKRYSICAYVQLTRDPTNNGSLGRMPQRCLLNEIPKGLTPSFLPNEIDLVSYWACLPS